MSNGGSYDPHAVESEIYRFWEEGGHFHAVPDAEKAPFVIDIPLPNVTGALHLGHAINQTLQDILIRQKRMAGFNAMWMPGTDHAGIATQAVVERKLKEEEGRTRQNMKREELVQRIWGWKEEYGGRILSQLRKMGFSCDWERTRFTLDEVCAKAVYEVFFQWFKAGLIYRGQRLVNWDAHLQTAVADDEVIHETVQGHFWHYRYPVLTKEEAKGLVSPDMAPVANAVALAAIGRATAEGARVGTDYLSIATTRPETMLGDTAVCVHPDDERYRHLIGRYVLLPLQNRAIPVIGDGLLAKMERGTGCVKVTPGHDPNDYACGQRNGLMMANILTVDGKINDQGGGYAGMDRYAARGKVVADLEALGLMEKVEDYEHEVGHSDRSKTPIEPMLSEQWFVKMADLAELAMEAVRDGRVKFFPDRYAKTLLDWLGEKRDWCISRQLWWGHRIPVWTCTIFPLGESPEHFDSRRWVNMEIKGLTAAQHEAIALQVEPAPDEGALLLHVCVQPREAEIIGMLEKCGFEHDPDVLDTWFSSALWPFSTLGWPHDQNRERERPAKAEAPAAPPVGPVADAPGTDQQWPTRADFDCFYPTSVLVTARDIITLWVARMIMTGLYFNGRVPFQHVCIHPNIQDGEGRRMSKSLGNGVDPLDIIELYGTDALRFTMAAMATETQDARLPVKRLKLDDGREINTSDRFEPARNLCNKLWQAATGFVLPNLDGYAPRPLKIEELAIEDRWIISRLGGAIGEVDRRLEHYQFSEFTGVLYGFFWSDFCDWYVELVKPRLFGRDADGKVSPRSDDSATVARQVLAWVLGQTLRLFHPVMPFVTEALWKKLDEKAKWRGIGEIIEAEPALIAAGWPGAGLCPRDAEIEREMTALQDVIRALRDTLARVNTSRSAAKTPAIGKLPKAVIRTDELIAAGLAGQLAVLQRLGRCETIEIGTELAKPAESATQVLTGVEVYVPLAGLMDLAAERQRLSKELDKLRTHIERLTGKLANEGFVSNAPPAVVEQERARLLEMKERYAALERNLADVGA